MCDGAHSAPTGRQQEAIESWGRGDVCVVAGPGSGKTFVLVERFKWLVQVQGIPVRHILAITFTEKAAANMRRRLLEAFAADSADRKEIERAYVSTIHAFCARLLRENAIAAAVDPEFRVLDEWEADFELRRTIEEAVEREYRARPEPVRDFLTRFGASGLPESLFSLYHALRAGGVSVAEAGQTEEHVSIELRWQRLQDAFARLASLPTTGWNIEQLRSLQAVLAERPDNVHAVREIQFNLNDFKRGSEQTAVLKQIRDLIPACRAALLLEENAAARQWLLEALARADERYRAAKRQVGALDYADLEECAIRLLERGQAGATPFKFSFVLMDEFQDTNPLQARLVGLLRAEGNFFAVGDINQSIYGFRHADPEVFRRYREQSGHVVELFENFRSRGEVLDAIKTIIAGAEGVEQQNLQPGHKFAPAVAPCLEILAVHASDGDEALRREARHVAARMQELRGTQALESGLAAYGDFAVLLRTTMQVRVFERVLRERGIPCQVTEGRGFYETREIQDLVCFLRLLLNPLDEISLAAVLRSPLAGVSDDTLLQLKLTSECLIDGLSLAPELDRFRCLFERYREERDYTPLDRLLGRLLSETGYEAWLLDQPGGAHKAANVRKLLALARRFHAAGLTGLQGFVDRVEDLRREEVREAEAEPPEQTPDAVRLMTVHAAKGLEFPVVFLPAINRTAGRDHEAISFFPGIGVGVRWRGELDAVAEAIHEERKIHNREETQRLFYVGMTRAKELLVLSASFGGRVQAAQWAANLKRNLGLDWSRIDNIDNQARHSTPGGIPVRLLQANQEPPATAQPPALRAEEPEMLWFDRAALDDQADTAVSASSVTLFALCPRKYYLSRYLGFDPAAMRGRTDGGEAGDEMDASEFGQQVHALLAAAVPREQADPEALRLAANFESSALGRRAASANRVEREQGFLIALDDRLLQGRVDLWFEEGGEIVLVDYKTDAVGGSEVAVRAAEYELQLRLYALAVERMAGARPQRAILYFLRPNLAVDVPLDPPLLEGARAKVEELFQAQSRVAFPLRAGRHCYHCPHFRGPCPVQFESEPAGDRPTEKPRYHK